MLRKTTLMLLAFGLTAVMSYGQLGTFHRYSSTPKRDSCFDGKWSPLDEAFIMCGKTNDPGFWDGMLHKTDQCGMPLWLRRYRQFPSQNEFKAMTVDRTGTQYVAAGQSDLRGSLDGWVVVTDLNGTPVASFLLQTNPIADLELTDVIHSTDNHYIVSGMITNNNLTRDIVIIKVDANPPHAISWSTRIGTNAGDDIPYSLIETNSGDRVVFCGYSQSLSQTGNQDLIVGDLDISSGNVNDLFFYGDNDEYWAKEIGERPNGDFYLTGYTNDNTGNANDLFWLELDPFFGIQHYWQFQANGSTWGEGITWNDNMQSYYITGYTDADPFGGVGTDACLLIIDRTSTPVLGPVFKYGGNRGDRFLAVDNYYSFPFMCGWTSSFGISGSQTPYIYYAVADMAGFTGCKELQWEPDVTTPSLGEEVDNQGVSTAVVSGIDFLWTLQPDWTGAILCGMMCKSGGIESQNLLDEVLQHEVTLAPNPAQNRITFGYQEEGGMHAIKVFDIQGAVIFEKDALSEAEAYELNLEGFSPGTYFAQIFTGDGQIFRKKFVKQ